MIRSENSLAKLLRMNKSLRHEEPDRVPIRDDFWASFVENWRKDLSLPNDADISRYYDFDYAVILPNSDPLDHF